MDSALVEADAPEPVQAQRQGRESRSYTKGWSYRVSYDDPGSGTEENEQQAAKREPIGFRLREKQVEDDPNTPEHAARPPEKLPIGFRLPSKSHAHADTGAAPAEGMGMQGETAQEQRGAATND